MENIAKRGTPPEVFFARHPDGTKSGETAHHRLRVVGRDQIPAELRDELHVHIVQPDVTSPITEAVSPDSPEPTPKQDLEAVTLATTIEKVVQP